MFTDFHSQSLSAKEAAERREELEALNDAHLCWCVKTSEWEEYAMTEDERKELVLDAIADGLCVKVTELPF